jgi:hypothetical protein
MVEALVYVRDEVARRDGDGDLESATGTVEED